MGKVIHFKERVKGPPDNLITSEPLEFRWSGWETNNFIQMLKSQSARLEEHRTEAFQMGGKGISSLPPHYVLKDSMASTIHALYKYRNNEKKMREVYYLAGLVDCMVNQVTPLLRTDLLRHMYNEVMSLKTSLKVNWYGAINQVFFPIDYEFYNDVEYRNGLSSADTLKELYCFIREETDEMFDIFSLEYIFYTPGRSA